MSSTSSYVWTACGLSNHVNELGRTYPVEYAYDTAGRMTNMTTWQNFNQSTGQGISGAATTAWNYHPQRGWLQSKRYPDPVTGLVGASGTDYEYSDVKS